MNLPKETDSRRVWVEMSREGAGGGGGPSSRIIIGSIIETNPPKVVQLLISHPTKIHIETSFICPVCFVERSTV
jgi:hypothetical protein